jgi:hypothetical protein
MRQRHFAGTNLKPHKVPENAQTPTSRVHAVLGGVFSRHLFMDSTQSNIHQNKVQVEHSLDLTESNQSMDYFQSLDI